jgi:hypothetical protein
MQIMMGKRLVGRVAGVLALTASLLAPLAATAAAGGDPLIDGAKLCTQYFPGEEQKNSIPTHLLAAIATTESGRWHSGLGMNVPWPWTINVDGKGYYFNSKAEAIAQVQRLQAQGHESIDVGCMQVNLKHHAKAFATLNEAFDPATNVAYAAKFLHDNYAELGDWIKATAAYHSRTPVYGQQYLGEIERSWNRIVAKVAAARAHEAGEPGSELASNTPPVSPATFPAATQPVRPIADTHHVRIIKVADEQQRRASNVLVVRPAPQPEPAAVKVADVASAAPVAVTVQPNGESIRRVSFDSTPASYSQTKFVFAN